MSDQERARRSLVSISIAGADITSDIKPYFVSASYTDNEEDEADDLQITLQDRDGTWLTNWVKSMLDAASTAESGPSKGRLKIEAAFYRENWNGDGKNDTLKTGSMELDSLDVSGPPSTLTIKATSLPFSTKIRQDEQSRAWESYYLSKIAEEIAAKQGMTCMFLSDQNPFYRRAEQYRMSDIKFLSWLCHAAGISLKTTNNQLVLFNQKTYEQKDAIMTIRRGSKTYIKYKLGTGKGEVEYQSCRVSYVNPATGQCIEGVVTVEDYDAEATTNQQLEITAAVSSIAEAYNLAAKYLRLYNKYTKQVTFTLPGNTTALAGLPIKLEGWGAFDDTYFIKSAKHSVTKQNGYTTQITCRSVVPYFDPPAAVVQQAEAAAAAASYSDTGYSGGGSGNNNINIDAKFIANAIVKGVKAVATVVPVVAKTFSVAKSIVNAVKGSKGGGGGR